MGGDRAQCILSTTHLHTPFQGLPVFPPPCNPWVLYGTPRLLIGAGFPEKPGEAEYVPQGAPAPRPCWELLVWGWMVWVWVGPTGLPLLSSTLGALGSPGLP